MGEVLLGNFGKGWGKLQKRLQRLRCASKALTRKRDRIILVIHHGLNNLKGASKSRYSGKFRTVKSRKSQYQWSSRE